MGIIKSVHDHPSVIGASPPPPRRNHDPTGEPVLISKVREVMGRRSLEREMVEHPFEAVLSGCVPRGYLGRVQRKGKGRDHALIICSSPK
jgi:hypothetical protein